MHNRSGDQRAYGLEWLLKDLDVNSTTGRRPISDPGQSYASSFGHLSEAPKIFVGCVWDTIAFLHCYRVALDGGQSVVMCNAISHGAGLAFGAREIFSYPPGTQVIVLRYPRSPFGTILGTLPPVMTDGSLCLSDYLVQGSRVGITTDAVHTTLFQLYNSGNLYNYGAHRPVDSIPVGEWGAITETGLRLSIDPHMLQLAVDEATGIFGYYADSLLRIAGYNLQERSALYEREALDDEGELNEFFGFTPYFWERMGSFARSGNILRDIDVTATQEGQSYYAPVEPADDSRLPFFRYQRFRGYLGQGEQRYIVAPPEETSNGYALGQTGQLPGLFHDHLSLTGRYTAVSAKGFMFVKRMLIPVPLPQKKAEDPNGDTAENYKPAGAFGEGSDHVVKADLRVPSAARSSMTRAAGILDLMANIMNWEGVHPFAYHQKDWLVPEEEELSYAGNRDNTNIPFSDLQSKTFLEPPTPKEIKVDDRLGKVQYFPNMSIFGMLDDGGVVISDGFGSEIRMAGGNIVLAPAGDLLFQPGRNVTALAGYDIVLRAKNSVDISANDADVRLKAERNLQAMAGNGGTGGILLECKGSNGFYDFVDKQGEDATGAGILFKSANAPIVGLSRDLYFRANVGEGVANITLDAGENGTIYTNANYMVNTQSTLTHDFKDGVNSFSSSYASFCGGAGFDDWVSGQKGLFVGEGGLFTTGRVASSDDSGLMGVLRGKSLASTISSLQRAQTANTVANTRTRDNVEQLVSYWEDDNRPGNSEVMASIGFSYRTTSQYKTESFEMLETRWQMLMRKAGGGTNTWKENPVTIASGETYPYPGKEKWAAEETFFKYDPTLYDIEAGHSKPRGDGEQYADPQYGDQTGEKPDDHYPTIF